MTRHCLPKVNIKHNSDKILILSAYEKQRIIIKCSLSSSRTDHFYHGNHVMLNHLHVHKNILSYSGYYIHKGSSNNIFSSEKMEKNNPIAEYILCIALYKQKDYFYNSQTLGRNMNIICIFTTLHSWL